MQIETDDVTASHSSFTGRVDKEQLYYLQSRGLSKEESQDLLVNAFLESVKV
jgi:Fe-S cluster assembly protein SufD